MKDLEEQPFCVKFCLKLVKTFTETFQMLQQYCVLLFSQHNLSLWALPFVFNLNIGIFESTCFLWPLCLVSPSYSRATRINAKVLSLFSYSCTNVEKIITDSECVSPQSVNIGGKIRSTALWLGTRFPSRNDCKFCNQNHNKYNENRNQILILMRINGYTRIITSQCKFQSAKSSLF